MAKLDKIYFRLLMAKKKTLKPRISSMVLRGLCTINLNDKKSCTDFCCCRANTSDAERTGSRIRAATLEEIEKIHDMGLVGRKLEVREIVTLYKAQWFQF